MAVIQDLPNELLCAIIVQLYHANRKLYDEWAILLESPEMARVDWESYDPRDASFFPSGPSRVCQLWQSVMARYPYFWTRIAFDLASQEPLPLGAFSWSKEQHFEVLIFDSRLSKQTKGIEIYSTPTTTLHGHATFEKNRIEAITRALTPCLGRCTSLEFDVVFASSLPRLSVLLQHTPRSMDTVKLDCKMLNVRTSLHSDASICKGVTLTPFASLRTLSLQVVDFIAIGRMNPRFWELSGLNKSLHLGLHHYDFSGSEARTSIPDAVASTTEFLTYLTSLESLNSLQLRNLSVCFPPEDSSTALALMDQSFEPQMPLWDLSSFDFEDLSEEFLESFLQYCKIYSEDGTIKNCKFPRNADRLGACEFTIYNLPIDANPARVVNGFNGVTLFFEACPFLDDDTIFLLSDSECNIFTGLELHDCDGYTIEGLKELVTAREALARDTDRPPMESLSLTGRGPKPTTEDIEWFTKRLTRFTSI